MAELDDLMFGSDTDLAPPVDCPTCGAPAGFPCNGESEGTTLKMLGIPCVHGRRWKARQAAESTQEGSPDA
jgi:hypothetical protein